MSVYGKKLLATILGAFVFIGIAFAACLQFVSQKDLNAIARYDHANIEHLINQEIDSLVWQTHRSQVTDLARELSQDRSIWSSIQKNDNRQLESILPQLWRRAVVSSHKIALLGVTVLNPNGIVLARRRVDGISLDDSQVRGKLARRQGLDKLKIFRSTWLSAGRPIMSVGYPIGGLRPHGLLLIHVDPLNAAATLDRRLGVGIEFRPLDGEASLLKLTNWTPELNADLRSLTVTVNGPNRTPIMTAHVVRDVAMLSATMDSIRFWSTLGLLAVVITVALAASLVILSLTAMEARHRGDELCRIAMDNLPQGVLMIDRDEQISVVNKRLLDIYNLSAEIVKPGCLFIDLSQTPCSNGFAAT